MTRDSTQDAPNSPAPRRGLGVSGRLLGAIIVPVVVLSVSLAASVASSHRDAERAAVVSEHVAVLRQLVELRSAVFRERLAFEIFVPSRRPPSELLAGTAFGAQIVADPAQLTERTNTSLDAIGPADRPFTREDLDRARVLPVVDARAGAATQGAFDDVDAKLREAMAADLTTVRETAIDLGDVGLIRTGTRLDRSIRPPKRRPLWLRRSPTCGPPSRRIARRCNRRRRWRWRRSTAPPGVSPMPRRRRMVRTSARSRCCRCLISSANRSTTCSPVRSAPRAVHPASRSVSASRC
jgi:hypothetical protein